MLVFVNRTVLVSLLVKTALLQVCTIEIYIFFFTILQCIYLRLSINVLIVDFFYDAQQVENTNPTQSDTF